MLVQTGLSYCGNCGTEVWVNDDGTCSRCQRRCVTQPEPLTREAVKRILVAIYGNVLEEICGESFIDFADLRKVTSAIEQSLSTLDKRQQSILRLHYLSEPALPLRRVAQYVLAVKNTRAVFLPEGGVIKGTTIGEPVTPERVRQLRAHALRIMRHPSRSRRITEALTAAALRGGSMQPLVARRRDLRLPPSQTPAYDALAELGAAVIYGNEQLVAELKRRYEADFLGE